MSRPKVTWKKPGRASGFQRPTHPASGSVCLGTPPAWAMRQEHLAPAYTTRWDEILRAR
ncbi:DUF4113 domain-containing protein [Stenotrophomonas rhizophila]